MTHALLAAKTGWGKSWFTQLYIEENLPTVDYALILDYKDEYRGLAKAGMVKWMGVGDKEASLDYRAWKKALESNGKLILARMGVRKEEWQAVCAEAILAAREIDGECLVALDEVHFLAPQQGAVPDEISGLPTTGRGEGVSSLNVTQRLARVDEDLVTQADRRILGGVSSNDLDKIEGIIEYPVDVHDTTIDRVSKPLPDELLVDGEPLALRRFEDDEERTLGSEWVRSSDNGQLERVDTREKTMKTTHYGDEGHKLKDP